jgi:peptidase E
MSGPIVAIGGAEFVMRPENEALHDYILRLAPAAMPRICLLPTASGDPHHQISSFHAAMDRRVCVATSVSLFRLAETDIELEEHLLEVDIIYVTGGNMVNLMALWREHGLDRVLRLVHERGAVLCGYSAGSMCWFEHGVSTGVGRPVSTAGIGLLEGSHCVHYSQDPARRSAYRDLVAEGEIGAGLALDDHAAVRFQDGELVDAVRSRESSRAFRVEPDPERGATEEVLPSRLIAPARAPPEAALEEMRAIRRIRAGSPGAARAPGRRR